MKTPIADLLKSYSSLDVSRLHMPGHKGKSYTGCEAFDITEIKGADVLYSAEGIIRESEDNASKLFASRTFYSTEGSTLAIKAMLKLATDGKREGGRPLILAGRNAHKSFISAVALLDLDVKWLYPEAPSHIASCIIDAKTVADKIDEGPRPCAVYITSPDYLGNISDVKEIAEVCNERGIPLLVDNAHGAYLAFLSPSEHPIRLGAAMCADSAHKTLPVLTGGAYLHISENYPEYIERAESALSLFASTSPSYLILRSLDTCNAYLEDGYREKLALCIEKVARLCDSLKAKEIPVVNTEPLKLTVSPKSVGYTGYELADVMRGEKIECEFADEDYTVMMITPDNTDEDLERVYNALANIERRQPILSAPPAIAKPERAMSIREAVLSPSERIPTSCAVGRICASVTVSCPPAIPISIAGEVITEQTKRLFDYYGTDTVEVVK